VQPDLLYDYYGFEPEAYELQYRAPGAAALAAAVSDRLRCADSLRLACWHGRAALSPSTSWYCKGHTHQQSPRIAFSRQMHEHVLAATGLEMQTRSAPTSERPIREHGSNHRITVLFPLKHWNSYRSDGMQVELVTGRGWDHGVFIPLLLMLASADIPILQVSLLKSLDPAAHLRLGQSLASLREQGVFILGSGMSYHNMRGFGSGGEEASKRFHDWLTPVVCNVSPEKRCNSQAPTLRSLQCML
jgi:hypothetical protein